VCQAELLNGLVEGCGCPVRGGVAAAGEVGVDSAGYCGAGRIGDSPHGGYDVLVTDELHGGGEVDGLVEVTDAACGSLARV
jgi:hypothetical protein